MKTSIKFAAVMAGLMGLASSAGAVTLVLNSTQADPLGTRYNYGGVFAIDSNGDTAEGVLPGSTFIIYDFAGYVDGTVTSGNANVAASVEALSSLSLLPPGIVDDPTIANLVFTWIGSPFTPPADYVFSGYSAVSTYSDIGNTLAFGSQTLKVSNNSPLYTEGFVEGPSGFASPVPEPATWAMMAMGFGIIGISMQSRRRQRIAQI
ncbi:PEPxxWA-CTERM sorting domain-containing protein [Sphingomonas quercus]|uniref:PEPxxWA-CTERM sorting domain-containing protein n=1 Tax=Sphingomonas quercus TaxID=2842451 RepID=A0ABS6BNW4_9SPHN|nr:PEPxxWA-CTERM sorting domain-containing protein [Sphingomonas quercus]MBU3079481.1 PEPxxWA-CTERM sorting domain-containing protein [Sphingomonas quercus]